MGRLPHHIGIALAALLALSFPALAGELKVVKTGKPLFSVEAYEVGADAYLSAGDAAKIYGGQLYWGAVQESVQLSFRGKRVGFTVESNAVVVDDRAAELPRPVIVRARTALIPIEFFSGTEFSALVGVETRYDAGAKTLWVDSQPNIGALRWFTYSDHTRVVLEIGDDLHYKQTKRGLYGFDVTLPNGRLKSPQRVDADDGALEFISLEQEALLARLSLKLMDGADGVDLKEFQNPRRLVIDINRKAVSKTAAVAAADRVSLEAPAAPVKKGWFGAAKKPPAAPAVSSGEDDPSSNGGSLQREAAGAPASQSASDDLSGGEAGAAGGSAEEQAAAGSEAKFANREESAGNSAVSGDAKKTAAGAEDAKVPVAVRGRARPVIAVDAGHGGQDGGTVGRRGTLEKDINLAAAKELAELLREDGRFEVVMVRGNDKFVKLGDRAEIANKAGAELFVSLHCNANPSRAESGFEIYFLSEKASDPGAERLAEFENSVLALEDEENFDDAASQVLYALARTEFLNDSAELAGLIGQSVSRRVDLKNRGVKQAAFYVLRGANSPAVLVEMAFLSNARDETKLKSEKYRRKIIEGLKAGILDFAKRKNWLAGGVE